MAQSMWDELRLSDAVTEILRRDSHVAGHKFGRPFLTPYQIAIELRTSFRPQFDRIGKPLGGKGTGQQDSVAQYLALQLARLAETESLPQVQGAFLARAHLDALTYSVGGESITSSSEQAYDLSMYRLVDPE
jgi:hypothetical protein